MRNAIGTISLLSLCSCLLLFCTAAPCARARIAPELLRPALRAATTRAAACGAPAGRYVVRMVFDGEGATHEVELVERPEGTAPQVAACVVAAFAQTRVPDLRRPGSRVVVSWPFVVAAPDPG